MFKYLSFLWNSKNEHRVHSPFVYDLQMNIFKDTQQYYAFDELRKYANKNLTYKSLKQLFRFINQTQPSTVVLVGNATTEIHKTITLAKSNIKLYIINSTQEFKRLPLPIDIFYIESNQLEDYYPLIKSKSNNQTAVIITKPHQSSYWSKIIEYSELHVSLDLFDIGFLFFRKQQVKEHFILRT